MNIVSNTISAFITLLLISTILRFGIYYTFKYDTGITGPFLIIFSSFLFLTFVKELFKP